MKKAFLQLHIAVFLAGFTGVLGRLITLNEGMIVWYRLLITAFTMWVLYSLRKKMQRLALPDLMQVAGVGFIAAMHWITFYAAIKYANISVALVCFSALGFFTALFEPLLLRKRVNMIELLLGIMTIGGIALIFHFDAEYKTGIILGIISAMLGALFPIYNRMFLQRGINVETMLAWEQTGGFLLLSGILPFYLQHFPVDRFWPDTGNLMWLLVLSLLCSVVAFQFSSNALKKLSAFTVNLTYNLEPVYGILLAFVIYKENKLLSKWFFIGFGVICIALIIHLTITARNENRTTAQKRMISSTEG
jgi:drug/metabolite transporter (DMT)-like permease